MADGILGTIGELASPIEGALDFVAPQPEQYGGGLDLGSLMGSIGRGARNTFLEGAVGVAGAAVGAFNPNSDMALKDRLLMGGIALGAGGLMAREAHRAWSARVDPLAAMATRQVPSGYNELVQELGSANRGLERMTPHGELYFRDTPGVRPQTSNLLGAQDDAELLEAIRGWDPANLDAEASATQILADYQLRVGGLRNAQFDLSRFEAAASGYRVLKGDAKSLNGRARRLFERFTTEPHTLERAEVEELTGAIDAVARATELADVDLSVGPVGRISRVDLMDDGTAVATVTYPKNWDDGLVSDPLVRAARFKALNHRQFAQVGERNIRHLFELGKEYFDTGSTRFGSRMDLGPDWYRTAREDVAREFGLPNEPSRELESAVAAVSFLSEAEDWATNIPKARKILEHQTVRNGTLDHEFLAWLRDPSGFGGAAAKKHKATLNEIHGFFQDPKNFPDGKAFKVSKSDLKVILRLVGADETTREIFRSTKREKQKNFFLNIYDPDLEFPTTIDRHAYDVFFGIDTGIQDRPVMDTTYDGELNYDVIADTYRRVAAQVGLTPHQVQAVTWEMWRILKKERYDKLVKGELVSSKLTNTWKRFDPFRLPAMDAELRPMGENLAFEIVNGRGIDVLPAVAIGAPSTTLPAQMLDTPTSELATSVLPDGSVVHSTAPDSFSALELRHLYPALEGVDGSPRWLLSEPQRVASVDQVRTASRADVRAYGESFLKTELQGPHPALDPVESIVFELDGNQVPAVRGMEIDDMGPISVDRPERQLEIIDPNEVEVNRLVNPDDGYFATHQWAAITPPDFESARRLRVELEERGYKPMRVDGTIDAPDAQYPVITREDIWDPATNAPRGEADVLGARSQAVSHEEFQRLAHQGRIQLDELAANSSPVTALDDNWTTVKASGWDEVQKPWGGATIDAHTGEALPQGTNQWAITVKEDGMETVSIPEGASREEFEAAMDEALEKFRPVLERQQHYLGLFHDDDLGRIDIDPVLVVDSVDQVRTIGAASRAIGGAYNFADGNGYWPPHVSAEASNAGLVTFGLPPAEAAELAAKYGSDSVMMPQGRLYADGRLHPTEGVDIGSDGAIVTVRNEEIPLRVRMAEGVEPYPVDPAELLRTQSVTRRKYRARLAAESDRDILTVADELESTHGGRQLAVYTNRHDIDGDWNVAYEHVYDDGVNVYSTRTKNGDITSPNSAPVLVRDGGELPDRLPEQRPVQNPTAPAPTLNYGSLTVDGRGATLEPGADLFDMKVDGAKLKGIALMPEGFVAYVGDPPEGALATIRRPRSKTVQIEAIDTGDLAPAIRARAALEALGFEDFKFTADGREFGTPARTSYDHEQLVYFKDGTVAPRAPRDHPLQWFTDKHGFVFDIGYRVGNRVDLLSDDIVTSVDDLATRMFDDGFDQAFERWRPSKIKVRDVEGGYGEMGWQPGTPVFLDRSWFHNPELFRAALAEDRATGRLARNASNEPASVVAHEFGHIVHGAVKLAQNFGQDSEIDRQLRELVMSHTGARTWGKGAASTISQRASVDTSELVAEAFSEVFTPGPNGPSALSRKVVDLMRGEMQSVNRYRKPMVG